MEIDDARRLLADAQDVVVLTGAGFSAESGVPTFRGEGGLWKKYRAEDLATPEAFARDPKLVWEWYDWRRGKVAEARPNPGHEALVRLEEEKHRFTIVTQNVDRLHQLAGSQNVIELHGSLWVLRCTSCGEEREDRTTPLPKIPPRCHCGTVLRPGVVWFGESLPPGAIESAMRLAQRCDLMIVAGTSAVVYPAAGVAQVAVQMGHSVIEINPEPTGLSAHVTLSIRGKSGEVLPQIVA